MLHISYQPTSKVYYFTGFSSFIFSFGTNDTVSFLTVSSLESVKDAVCFISVEDAPIFTSYFPASAIHDELTGSNEERRRLSITKDNVWDSPCLRSLVFEKPFSSRDGLSSFTAGAVRYSSTTSFPATVPLFFTSTVTVMFPENFGELSLRLL